MWTKVVALGGATVLAILSIRAPNPNPSAPAPGTTQKKPSAAVVVVNEGSLAALLVQPSFQLLATCIYALIFVSFVFTMWYQEATGWDPSGRRFAEWDFADVLGLAAVVLGAGLRLWCYRTLARHFTFRVAILRDHELVQTGPYALLLHPSYTGAVLVQFGLLILTVWDRLWLLHPFPLSLVPFELFALVLTGGAAGALYRRVKVEEATLHRHFGKRWEAHAATRWRFIPFLL